MRWGVMCLFRLHRAVTSSAGSHAVDISRMTHQLYVVINYSGRSMMDDFYLVPRGGRQLRLCPTRKERKKKTFYFFPRSMNNARFNASSKNSECNIFRACMCARSAGGRNCGGSWTRALPPTRIAAKDGVQRRDIHEVSGDVVPINMVKGIGHLRDPRLNKVFSYLLKFS